VRKFTKPSGGVVTEKPEPPVEKPKPKPVIIVRPKPVIIVKPKPVCKPAPDKEVKRVCDKLKSNDFCFGKKTKQLCSKTCNTCEFKNDNRIGMREKSFSGGHQYFGG